MRRLLSPRPAPALTRAAEYENGCKDATGTALASYTLSADGTLETGTSATTDSHSGGTALLGVSTSVLGGAIGAGMVLLGL